MIRYFCNLVEGTNKPLSGACMDTDFSSEPPEDHPYEISEEVFNNLNRAELKDGVWVLEDESTLPPPPNEETQEEKIERLESEVAEANETTLTTMSALADVFEMVLALQAQIDEGGAA